MRVMSLVSPSQRSVGRFAQWAMVFGALLGPVQARGEAPSGTGGETRARGPLVTFAGLRVNDDKSCNLWVQMTESRNVTLREKGNTLVYFIEGAKIEFRNNENPLLAQHFGANVLTAKLDHHKNGVTFTLRLRKPASEKHRLVVQEGGSAALQIEIPPPGA